MASTSGMSAPSLGAGPFLLYKEMPVVTTGDKSLASGPQNISRRRPVSADRFQVLKTTRSLPSTPFFYPRPRYPLQNALRKLEQSLRDSNAAVDGKNDVDLDRSPDIPTGHWDSVDEAFVQGFSATGLLDRSPDTTVGYPESFEEILVRGFSDDESRAASLRQIPKQIALCEAPEGHDFEDIPLTPLAYGSPFPVCSWFEPGSSSVHLGGASSDESLAYPLGCRPDDSSVPSDDELVDYMHSDSASGRQAFEARFVCEERPREMLGDKQAQKSTAPCFLDVEETTNDAHRLATKVDIQAWVDAVALQSEIVPATAYGTFDRQTLQQQVEPDVLRNTIYSVNRLLFTFKEGLTLLFM